MSSSSSASDLHIQRDEDGEFRRLDRGATRLNFRQMKMAAAYELTVEGGTGQLPDGDGGRRVFAVRQRQTPCSRVKLPLAASTMVGGGAEFYSGGRCRRR
ncbi:pyridoxal phosphate (PLP)-dependent transferasessuperfamily protein [Striga asiatica]|uniref:Pyridoxal phosphate (PLP)-dependent transferasessuperfamily protein n=1 Tax=Striga asiatica TaxID=4170 RepID=A0A5A7R359_STRAF|nr:pyridoxal phosphate (PLP)-dependent transferasessuperfamily protein [Striga asiatica]